jgi:uncharacterized protein
MVGLFYQQGFGLPSDGKAAVYWYIQAAQQGMDNAQLLLGVMYGQGQGVPRDLRAAYAWLDLASTSSNGDIRNSALKMRDELAKNMTAADINAAKQLAQSYYSKYATPQ